MSTLKNHRKITSGKIWISYFKAAKSQKLYPNEKGQPVFESDGKDYVVTSYDHFNAHFSGYSDENAIFSMRIAEVKK